MAQKVMEEKQAEKVAIILMNPQNGEIYAMVNWPEFNLNEPFELPEGTTYDSEDEKQELLNQMWRNGCINDTYEPGSTFKIITSSACLEEGVVDLDDTFVCPGYKIVEDRRIRCHKVGGHGAETFVEGVQNSCNPVFMEIGLRLGAERFCDYFEQFGLMEKTGVDLPGEASTIMHRLEDIGEVELATMTFGQSFQVTPVQMAATVSSLINGGKRVTPHFGVEVLDSESGKTLKTFSDKQGRRVISEKTSETMRNILESVVSVGSGKTPISRDTVSEERRPRPRLCQEAPTNIFLPLLALLRPKIRRFWECVLSTTLRESIMAERSQPRLCGRFLMTYCRTLASKNKRTQSLKRKSDRDRKEEQPAAERKSEPWRSTCIDGTNTL